MKRRDITLGEMQDECKTRVKCCTGCPYKEVCGEIPKLLDLTDPPRFTDEQMALLKALWDLGVHKVIRERSDQDFLTNAELCEIRLRDLLGMSYETLELAEMFGKEAKE